MTTQSMHPAVSRSTRTGRRAPPRDAMQYRVIFAACLIVFSVATVVERLWSFATRSRAQAGIRQSWIVEARDAAHRCAALAFSG